MPGSKDGGGRQVRGQLEPKRLFWSRGHLASFQLSSGASVERTDASTALHASRA